MVVVVGGSPSAFGARVLVASTFFERRLCTVVFRRVCANASLGRQKNHLGVGWCAGASDEETTSSKRHYIDQFSGIHAGTKPVGAALVRSQRRHCQSATGRYARVRRKSSRPVSKHQRETGSRKNTNELSLMELYLNLNYLRKLVLYSSTF